MYVIKKAKDKNKLKEEEEEKKRDRMKLMWKNYLACAVIMLIAGAALVMMSKKAIGIVAIVLGVAFIAVCIGALVKLHRDAADAPDGNRR